MIMITVILMIKVMIMKKINKNNTTANVCGYKSNNNINFEHINNYHNDNR